MVEVVGMISQQIYRLPLLRLLVTLQTPVRLKAHTLLRTYEFLKCFQPNAERKSKEKS